MKTLVLLAGALGLCSAPGCVLRHSSSPPAASIKTVRVDQLDELPVLREWPAVTSTAAPDSAPVTVQVLLDTAGRVVKELTMDVSSLGRPLQGSVRDVIAGATFSHPRVQGEPRRALLELTIDLGRHTASVAPQLSERVVWLEEMLDDKPEVVSGPALVYPAKALQDRITGRVLIQVIIDTTGHPEPASVRMIQGVRPDLNGSALYYVNNATFAPGRLSGRPVRTLVNLPIDFLIGGR